MLDARPITHSRCGHAPALSWDPHCRRRRRLRKGLCRIELWLRALCPCPGPGDPAEPVPRCGVRGEGLRGGSHTEH